ncbi:hypothetical protein HKX48_004626 [Thoreauomyces humboldtii]|nr:hypothetical protein HKX48_004626 [Thoreauomyces humboldtii]
MLFGKLIVAAAALASVSASAIPSVLITTEAELSAGAWDGPLYTNFVSSINGTVAGVPRSDGGALTIPWVYHKSISGTSKNTVVIVNGHGETFIKYREFIYDLNQNGFNTLAFDHRGQGFAGRIGCPVADYSDVDHFENYMADMQTVITSAQQSVLNGQNLLLFAHSMGGGIAGGYLEKFPNTFKAAVLNAPMLEINTAPYPGIIALPIAEIVEVFGKCNLAPGQSATIGAFDFSTDTTTHSLERFTTTRSAYQEFPQVQLAGTTARWVQEAMVAIAGYVLHAKQATIPVQMHQAGQDTYVMPTGQNIWCAGLKVLGLMINKPAAQCNMMHWPAAKHEIWNEVDSTRTPYMQSVVGFLRQYTI